MKNPDFFLPFIIFLLLQPFALQSQNLFDSTHTLRYADHLYSSSRYKDATEEYERYIFLFDATEREYLRLVRSYRKSGDPLKALGRMESLWSSPLEVSRPVSREFLGLQILTSSDYHILNKIQSEHQLPDTEKAFLASAFLLLNHDHISARELLETTNRSNIISLEDLYNISVEAAAMRRKSPFVSGFMSTLLPGSGKIYTGSVGDGLISMLMVGSMGWQAYRGFSKDGTSSAYGWIFASVGAGFYFGNIWGSVKAAHKHNFQQKERIQLRVKTIFDHHL